MLAVAAPGKHMRPSRQPRQRVCERYLVAALAHPHFARDAGKLVDEICKDFNWRGLDTDRQYTFRQRIRALTLLLANTGQRGATIPPGLWDAQRVLPASDFQPSAEQQEVLDAVERGVAKSDANADADSRLLLVSGPPSAGQTEVVAARAAAAK